MNGDGNGQASNPLSIEELRILAEHGGDERIREAAYLGLIGLYAENGDYVSLCILAGRKDLPKAVNTAAGTAIESAAMRAIGLCAGSPDEESTLISLIKYPSAPTAAKNTAVERIVELRLRSSRWDALYILAGNGQAQEVKDYAAMRAAEYLVENRRYESLLHYAKNGPEALQKAARAQLSLLSGTLAARCNTLAGDGTLSAGTVRAPATGKKDETGSRKARTR
ncbi:MAG: hypothetical protein PHV13_05845 [Candidatus ainarchaeum sp.]|nr:hypothetical protein [Candidatus ainarchaeum sp.]